MNISYCVNQVYDPEPPSRAFKVDEAEKQVVPSAGNPVISQIAVEEALHVSEGTREGTIMVLSFGPDCARTGDALTERGTL